MPPEKKKRGPLPPIPLTVLTGFLGAGKTTLLNALLKSDGMADTAVIVNEFGDVGIDHLLVETADEGIIELSSGCLCCTIRGDLINTLEGLLRARDNGRVTPFRRTIIETTGLADPAPVLHTIMNHPYLVMRFRLDGVVTVVDAVNGAATLDNHEESVKQAAVADRIVMTKTDLCTTADELAALAALRTRLAALNPAAVVIDAVNGEVEAARLLDAGLFNAETKIPDVARWLNAESYDNHTGDHGHHHDKNRHDDHIAAFCITSEQPISVDSFNLFCELLRSTYGAQLLRVKGLILLADEPDRPVVIHGVQHVFHPPVRLDAWPDGQQLTRIVFITRDLARAQLDALFRAFAGPIDGAEARAAYEARDELTGGPRGGLL